VTEKTIKGGAPYLDLADFLHLPTTPDSVNAGRAS
jgi:hypothetical protein